MQDKKLYRSREEKMIGGVCGGLADYLNLDPTIVRLLFVMSFFFLYPGSILIYVILLLIMPEKTD